ncbi:hypothetical protein GCM10022239_03780 [Leifsonia bigeumensis]|uniref:RecT family protein n=1 Tax=Leifsonella bigeumensis TaxID=433643 RepID=A0ABP7F3Z1_9MICO
MSTALTTYDRSSLPERAQYAQTLAGAADLIPRGLFDKATGKPSPAKILLVMETGAMLGLHPMAALQGIDVIEGKATISPQLMTGLIRAAGHRLVIEKRGSVRAGDLSVTVTATRADSADVFTDTWDLDRAVRAGLCELVRDSDTGEFAVRARSEKGNPLPWEKYPELVMTWRTIGVVGREGFDDVLKGISYTPEELGADVSAEGVIEAAPEPSEDWAAAIEGCSTKEEVTAVVDRAKSVGDWNDEVRTLALARYGMLNRDPEPVDAGVEDDSGTDAVQRDAEASLVEREHDPAEPTAEEYAALAPEGEQ